MQREVSLTISNLTANQVTAVSGFLKTLNGDSETTTPGKRTRGRPRVEKTIVNEGEDDEEQEVLKSKEAFDDDESEEDEETYDDEEEDGEEESKVSFSQLKKLIDLYGEDEPKKMKVLLGSFNIKSTAELKQATSKWDAVYSKIVTVFKKGKR